MVVEGSVTCAELDDGAGMHGSTNRSFVAVFDPCSGLEVETYIASKSLASQVAAI